MAYANYADSHGRVCKPPSRGLPIKSELAALKPGDWHIFPKEVSRSNLYNAANSLRIWIRVITVSNGYHVWRTL